MDKKEASQKLYKARLEDRPQDPFNEKQENYQLTPTEKQTVKTIEQQLDYRQINHGASRIVFLKPDKQIIKIARYGNKNKIHDGRQQNSRETQLWKKLYEEHDKKVPYPLLEITDNDSKYYWIEQPPVVPLHNFGNFKKAKQVKETIHKQLRPLSTYINMFDITLSNIGINREGNPLLYDYGLKPEPIK